MARSICTGCHAVFTSVTAFDRHRIGEYERWSEPPAAPGRPGKRTAHRRKALQLQVSTRRCLDASEMAARGMERNARGWWSTGEHMAPDAFTGAA